MNTHQKILIIDHQTERQRQLMLALQHRGLSQIYIASNATKGLAQLEQQPISFLFYTLDLPGLSSLSLIRSLAELRIPPPSVVYGSLDASLLATAERMADAMHLPTLGWSQTPTEPTVLDAIFARLEARTHAATPPTAMLPPENQDIDDIVRGIAQGEFEPFFQPIQRLSDGTITGVEALARWRHHEKGLIHPASFIPVLERFDMMDAITGMMVERSAAACQRWRQMGVHLTVSVNLSALSLADTELADELANRVMRHRVSPQQFLFEFSEASINAHPVDAFENILRLRLHGFGLVIDNFGVGGTSFWHLSALPFTQIKVDGSFVHGVAGDPIRSSLLETGLELARRLNLDTAASGIERHADLQLLHQLKCNYAQGHLIASAMPEHEFLTWLTQHITPSPRTPPIPKNNSSSPL